MLPSRSGYAGPGGNSSRWNAPIVAGKTLEVQRSQIDELFKSLKSGDELAETEPSLFCPFCSLFPSDRV